MEGRSCSGMVITETGTAFFTGHRHLNSVSEPILKSRLQDLIQAAYEHGYRRFYCGCALGFDTLAAFETIRFRSSHPDILLSLAIPCSMQDRMWPEADRERYRKILRLADDSMILSPYYYQGCMLTRNIYMADRSSLCICYLTQMKGGTASAVRYAVSRDIPVINLALPDPSFDPVMKECSWSYTFTSRSAKKNAATVPSFLLSGKKLKQKTMFP